MTTSTNGEDRTQRFGMGVAQAFRTMTILPAFGNNAKRVSTQLYFFPLVGFVLGALGAAVVYILSLLCRASNAAQSFAMGVLWVVWMAYSTRAFHLDGLADTFDGFGGGWTKERRLEIMKDSRTGSFGVVAIVSCLLLKAAFSAILVQDWMLFGFIWVCTVSRSMVVFVCSSSKYAKPQGLSYDLVEQAGPRHFVVSLMWLVASAALCFAVGGLSFGLAVRLIASLFLSFVVAMRILVVSRRKIGGVTGDVLGAACELCEVAAIAGFAFARF